MLVFLVLVLLPSAVLGIPVWHTGQIPTGRSNMATTVLGGKAYFGGGFVYPNGYLTFTRLVYSYDFEKEEWTDHGNALSVARYGVGAAAIGTKIMFAGGIADSNKNVDVVDVYDVETQRWTLLKLVFASACSNGLVIGSKVLFAASGARMQVYDDLTLRWSTIETPKVASQFGIVLPLVFYADGMGAAVAHVYNTTANSWNKISLGSGEDRLGMSVVASGHTVLFAGGWIKEEYFSSTVDIYDVRKDLWTIARLSQPRDAMAATSVGPWIFFAGGRLNNHNVPSSSSANIDIYYTLNNTWSLAHFASSRLDGSAVSWSVNALFVGGYRPFIGMTDTLVCDVSGLANQTKLSDIHIL